MPRPALPQNYIGTQGLLFEDFETVGDWTNNWGGTFAANAVQYHTGTKSIKCIPYPDGGVTLSKTFGSQQPFWGSAVVLWVYFHTALNTVSTITLELMPDTGTTNKLSAVCARFLSSGKWFPMYFHRDSFTAYGSATWDGLIANGVRRMRILLSRAANQWPEISFDSFYIASSGIPRLVLCFDDNRDSIYNIAYPIMQAAGIVGTIYVISNSVDPGWGAGYMTLQNLQTLYNAGWGLANHTKTHLDLTTLSASDAQIEIQDCADWLISKGFGRAAHHLAYPGGQYNTTVISAAQSAGQLPGRRLTTDVTTLKYPWFELPCVSILQSTTLASVQGYVDTAIKRGGTYFLLIHKIGADSDAWSEANFQALINYIVACKIKCATIDEWYEGMTNLRYRAVPLSRSAV